MEKFFEDQINISRNATAASLNVSFARLVPSCPVLATMFTTTTTTTLTTMTMANMMTMACWKLYV